MTLYKRIEASLNHIGQKDYENALIHLTIAIDATSKKEMPNQKKQALRNTSFIDVHQDFIYRFSTNGWVSVTGSVIYPNGTFGRTLYKLIRCGLTHEGVLPDGFVFLDGPGIGYMSTTIDNDKPRGFGISQNLMIALALLVITSPNNINEKNNDINDLRFKFNDIEIETKSIWGDRTHLKTYPIWG